MVSREPPQRSHRDHNPRAGLPPSLLGQTGNRPTGILGALPGAPGCPIGVHSSHDGRARSISFDETEPDPEPPLELIRSSSDEEREQAWRLLDELTRQRTAD